MKISNGLVLQILTHQRYVIDHESTAVDIGMNRLSTLSDDLSQFLDRHSIVDVKIDSLHPLI